MKPRRYMIKGEARTIQCAVCCHYEEHGNRSGICKLSGRSIENMLKKTLCNSYQERKR